MTYLMRKYGDVDFEVLRHNPCRPELPLVVIVHPGDMVEDGYGYDPEDAKTVMQFSRQNQLGTAKEIAQWRSLPAEVIVVNRSSCTQYVARYKRNIAPELTKEMRITWRSDTVLYGDDLDKVNAWMSQHMALEGRPHVYLAGAYSDPEYGCLTAIGQHIAKIIGPDKVTVSEFSPASNDPAAKRWDPRA